MKSLRDSIIFNSYSYFDFNVINIYYIDEQDFESVFYVPYGFHGHLRNQLQPLIDFILRSHL